jgi:hypothetical protein
MTANTTPGAAADRLRAFCDAWDSEYTNRCVERAQDVMITTDHLRAVLSQLEALSPCRMTDDQFLAFADKWLEAKQERHEEASRIARDLIARTRALAGKS